MFELKCNGYTMTELTVMLSAVSLLGFMATSLVLDNPGATEKRAAESARLWLTEQRVDLKRLSCAYDSDGDGYGSCTVVTQNDERIFLQCPASWFNNAMGAHTCKEVGENIKLAVPKR